MRALILRELAALAFFFARPAWEENYAQDAQFSTGLALTFDGKSF
jgi:hypothetical protein